MLNLCPSEASRETGHAFTVYQIDIEGAEGPMTYTGWTSQGINKRAQDYRREVGRLLRGAPHDRAGGYRVIHLALASAMLEGWFASIRIVADAADADQARALERQHEARIRADARLNGRHIETSRRAFLRIVAAHLRRLGLDKDQRHRILGQFPEVDAPAPARKLRSIEPLVLEHHAQPVPAGTTGGPNASAAPAQASRGIGALPG